eukprot:357733-Chlamydomonas_euryale.AAC.9
MQRTIFVRDADETLQERLHRMLNAASVHGTAAGLQPNFDWAQVHMSVDASSLGVRGWDAYGLGLHLCGRINEWQARAPYRRAECVRAAHQRCSHCRAAARCSREARHLIVGPSAWRSSPYTSEHESIK